MYVFIDTNLKPVYSHNHGDLWYKHYKASQNTKKGVFSIVNGSIKSINVTLGIFDEEDSRLMQKFKETIKSDYYNSTREEYYCEDME